MSLTAAVIAELIGAGLDGRALVDACLRIEVAERGSVAPLVSPLSAVAGIILAEIEPEGDRFVTFEPGGDTVTNERWPIVNAVAMARKALNLVPGLSNGARQVAGAIIDHFNRTTGQCDPSIGRLAGTLSLSRRTIMRKIAELDSAGLIARARHGGKSHRNAYRPAWDAFAQIVGQWDARMADPKAAVVEAVSAVSPFVARCQPSHPNGAKPVTQTHVKNPDQKDRVLGNSGFKSRRPNPAQREMLYPMRTTGAAIAGLEAAKGRVSADVRERLMAVSKAAFVEGYSRIPGAVWDDAYAAEQHHRGGGVRVAMEFLQGVGPPMKATA